MPLNVAVTVIRVVPTFKAETTPLASTEATDASLERNAKVIPSLGSFSSVVEYAVTASVEFSPRFSSDAAAISMFRNTPGGTTGASRVMS